MRSHPMGHSRFCNGDQSKMFEHELLLIYNKSIKYNKIGFCTYCFSAGILGAGLPNISSSLPISAVLIFKML